MKSCNQCKELKVPEDFYKSRTGIDGREAICKKCKRALEVTRLKNPDYLERRRKIVRESAQRWRSRMTPEQAAKQKQHSKTAVKRWVKAHPEKRNAQRTAFLSMQEGKITRLDECQKCGLQLKLEMHHFDYSKPLEVFWVCKKCHAELHRKSKFEPVAFKVKEIEVGKVQELELGEEEDDTK